MPHKALELIGTAPCVDAEWRGRLGSAYCALSRFLVALPDTPLSETYYCPHCRGHLKVQSALGGTFVALADSEDATCLPVDGLVTSDLALKGLNTSAFYRTCLDGLGIDIRVLSLPGLASTWRLGSICVAGQRYAVFASLLSGASETLSVIKAISDDKPFIFFGGSYHHECEEFLIRHNCGFICLEDDFEILADTGFCPKDSATEKLMAFKAALTKTITPLDADTGASYLFRQAGEKWKVVFEGASSFDINDSLGPRYIHYLLHHPGEVISALELEIKINPGKESVRTKEIVTPKHDAQGMVAYAKECRRLRFERDSLREEGREMEASELDDSIENLERILRNEDKAIFSDSGERARQNVSKAIRAVETRLQKMNDPASQSFARHLSTFISKGLSMSYSPSNKIIWS